MSASVLFPKLETRLETNTFGEYKRRQARMARRRLYPLTLFYGFYSMVVSILAMRTLHPWLGLGFYLGGCGVCTLVEYLFHCFVLQGRFPPGKGIIRRFLHERLDPLHSEHHERPFDGAHISGRVSNSAMSRSRFSLAGSGWRT